MLLQPTAHGLPGPAYVVAGAVFFRCEVQGPAQPTGLPGRGVHVNTCFVQVPQSAWSPYARKHSADVPMGPAVLRATLHARQPDGAPVVPWSAHGRCLTAGGRPLACICRGTAWILVLTWAIYRWVATTIRRRWFMTVCLATGGGTASDYRPKYPATQPCRMLPLRWPWLLSAKRRQPVPGRRMVWNLSPLL